MSVAGISRASTRVSSLANGRVALSCAQGMERARPRARICLSLFQRLNQRLSVIPERGILVVPPPPIRASQRPRALRNGKIETARRQCRTTANCWPSPMHRGERAEQSAPASVSVRRFRSNGAAFDVEIAGSRRQNPACHHDQVFRRCLRISAPPSSTSSTSRSHLSKVLHPGRGAIPPDPCAISEHDGAATHGRQ